MVPYGLLLSYGPDLPDHFRKAAGYADKILHGAKPADLPVEQPTRFKQVINLKAEGPWADCFAIPADHRRRDDRMKAPMSLVGSAPRRRGSLD
jgi:hypothetical protein